MKDIARLAVHQGWRAHDLPAEDFADSLMTQAYAEYRSRFMEIPDDVLCDSCIRRSAWSRRNDNPRWFQPLDFLKRDLVVSKDAQLFAKLAKILHEIVRK